MDIYIPPKQEPREAPKEKEIGEYFDFPCPKCGARKVKIIVYGYIDNPDRLNSREVPGGCIVEDSNPKWRCKACEHEWGRYDNY